MSRKDEFAERVYRMAARNGLNHSTNLSTGAVLLFAGGDPSVGITVSMASRPCQVVMQFADGTIQRESWMVLEACCRNLAQGAVR